MSGYARGGEPDRADGVDVDADTARFTLVTEIRVRDLPQYRLMVWELAQLHDDMRVGASPFAGRLGRIIDRFVFGDPSEDE